MVDHPWPPVINNRIVERFYPILSPKVRHSQIVITTVHTKPHKVLKLGGEKKIELWPEDERTIAIDAVIHMVRYTTYNVVSVWNIQITPYPSPYTLLRLYVFLIKKKLTAFLYYINPLKCIYLIDLKTFTYAFVICPVGS